MKSKLSISLNTWSGLSSLEDFNTEALDCFGLEMRANILTLHSSTPGLSHGLGAWSIMQDVLLGVQVLA